MKPPAKHHSLERSLRQSLKSLTSGIDLRLLTEEVMNTNISGYQFRKSSESQSPLKIHPGAIPVSPDEQELSIPLQTFMI